VDGRVPARLRHGRTVRGQCADRAELDAEIERLIERERPEVVERRLRGGEHVVERRHRGSRIDLRQRVDDGLRQGREVALRGERAQQDGARDDATAESSRGCCARAGHRSTALRISSLP
jgi:hypothetical protein